VGSTLVSTSATPSPSPSPGSEDNTNTSTDDGGRSWIGPVIGAGLLALAGWTLWRSARVRRRYDDHADDHPDDPDLHRDGPDLL
jgi:hypothetical protein